MDNTIVFITSLIPKLIGLGITIVAIYLFVAIVYAIIPYSVQKAIRDAWGINRRKKRK